MDRRRALSSRPASSEEIQCWSHAATALSSFRDKYESQTTAETIARVNRLINEWPTSFGEDGEPMSSFETVKTTHRKLSSGLSDIKIHAEAEARAAEEALEKLSVLIALRRAPENPVQQEKRKHRNRGSSPMSNSGSGTPAPTPQSRVTLNLKGDRSSEGPTAQVPSIPVKRDTKTRAKFYSKQHPLREGRKVAFHPPSAGGGAEAENTWILAIVTRCLNHKDFKYEVKDAEPQEDGQPGAVYHATPKVMVPLPDTDALVTSPSHVTAYPEFQVGATVMALYPDTSCFYRAEVIQTPTQSSRITPTQAKQITYRLRFEDDDDQVHPVQAQWVVEWPGN